MFLSHYYSIRYFLFAEERIQGINNGGYNDGDPPLSIPNREVKPISADDTAIPSGKVGSCQFLRPSDSFLKVFFFVVYLPSVLKLY